MAVHQPGDPDLHRVFGDPQGDGGPRLQDPVSEPGQSWHLRLTGSVTHVMPGVHL